MIQNILDKPIVPVWWLLVAICAVVIIALCYELVKAVSRHHDD